MVFHTLYNLPSKTNGFYKFYNFPSKRYFFCVFFETFLFFCVFFETFLFFCIFIFSFVFRGGKGPPLEIPFTGTLIKIKKIKEIVVLGGP